MKILIIFLVFFISVSAIPFQTDYGQPTGLSGLSQCSQDKYSEHQFSIFLTGACVLRSYGSRIQQTWQKYSPRLRTIFRNGRKYVYDKWRGVQSYQSYQTGRNTRQEDDKFMNSHSHDEQKAEVHHDDTINEHPNREVHHDDTINEHPDRENVQHQSNEYRLMGSNRESESTHEHSPPADLRLTYPGYGMPSN